MRGGSIFIWGCFGCYGKCELVFLEKMNAATYKSILEKYLLTMDRIVDGNELMFQQDNAPFHRAKEILLWFKKKKIKVIEWPPLSQNLNHIKKEWGKLVKNIYGHVKQYRT